MLTRFTIDFNENIFELQKKLRDRNFKEKFNLKIKTKLNNYIEIKKQKLLVLQLLVEYLEKKWKEEYSNLARYYFNDTLEDFRKKYLENTSKPKDEYEEYLLR